MRAALQTLPALRQAELSQELQLLFMQEAAYAGGSFAQADLEAYAASHGLPRPFPLGRLTKGGIRVGQVAGQMHKDRTTHNRASWRGLLPSKQLLRDEGPHGLDLCAYGWRLGGLVWVRHYRDQAGAPGLPALAHLQAICAVGVPGDPVDPTREVHQVSRVHV